MIRFGIVLCPFGVRLCSPLMSAARLTGELRLWDSCQIQIRRSKCFDDGFNIWLPLGIPIGVVWPSTQIGISSLTSTILWTAQVTRPWRECIGGPCSSPPLGLHLCQQSCLHRGYLLGMEHPLTTVIIGGAGIVIALGCQQRHDGLTQKLTTYECSDPLIR